MTTIKTKVLVRASYFVLSIVPIMLIMIGNVLLPILRDSRASRRS